MISGLWGLCLENTPLKKWRFYTEMIFLALGLFVLTILILSLVGYASIISGAEAPTRWRRVFIVLTFGLVGMCCLVFALAVIIVIPGVGVVLTWPFSDPLIGEWQCIETETNGVLDANCVQRLSLEVGSSTWAPGATITFAKGGRLSSGNRSLLFRDGTVTSEGATCEYDLLDATDRQQARIDCGYGTGKFEYEINGDRLVIWLGSQRRIYQRVGPVEPAP